MTFDVRLFGGLLAQGSGLYGAGIAALGLPSCVLNLSAELLALLPGSVLIAVERLTAEYKRKIQEQITEGFNYLAEKLGIEQYFTDQGSISLRLDNSLLNLDLSLPAGIAALASAAADIYQNINNAGSFLREIKDCLNQIKDAMDSSNDPAFQSFAQREFVRDTTYAREIKKIEQALELKAQVEELEATIDNILYERLLDPSKEPKINPKYADLFSETSFEIGEPEEEEVEEVIRLVYGPPRSREGQFILSVDGLYYDSQSDEGLVPVLTQLRDREAALDASEKWMFNHDPNLGGKGDQVSERSFSKWINSVFDINQIDDSEMIQPHYMKDGFLQTLIGQRDKRIGDLDRQIKALEEDEPDGAIIANLKQSIISEKARHDVKINKRKKQIEVAVKAPGIFGGIEVFQPGKVPVNDFSYLQNFNISLALKDQQQLVINAEEVSGIVMPLTPKFVKVNAKNPAMTIDELYIPSMGYDAIITDGQSAEDPSGAEINLDEVVSTDGLFAMYNFLNSNVVLPSSVELNLNNCVTPDDYNNGQLVAKFSNEIFSNLGLAAPYLNGITVNSETNPTALGSFVKLPDTREFQDWTYRSSGFSFDTWVLAPDVEKQLKGWKDNDASGLYRLILANENTGIGPNGIKADDYNLIQYTDSSDFVRGMIVGFTIDRRWTESALPSNRTEDNDNGFGFLIAPTISYDASTVGFLANPGCDVANGWRGMFIPQTKTTESGKTLRSCSTEYVHLAFSVDYREDKITVYLDGEVLETSAVSDVFGTNKGGSIKIPSFKKENSFEYKPETVGSLAPKSLKNGPKTYPFFTPWILGGGYTDGYAAGGNFMGGEYGGQRSGLRGHLGSVKFYNKAITESQIKKNYDIQSKLFKTMRLKPISVIIALGQSNMDGSFASIISESGGLSTDIDARYYEQQTDSFIWTPDAVEASSGSWKLLDIVNTPIIPGFNLESLWGYPNTVPGYGGLNASRYFITAAADRFIPYDLAADEPIIRHFDPMVSFWQELYAYDQQEIYIIKNAKNSLAMVSGLNIDQSILSFTDNRHPGANVQGSGVYYTLKNDVSAAIQDLNTNYPNRDYEIKAVILIQGEFECLYTSATQLNYPDLSAGQMANQWGYYFSSVLYPTLQSDLKEMLGTPEAEDIPWIVGRTHIEMAKDIPPGGITPAFDKQAFFVPEVRAQQEAVANHPDLNVHLVDLDGIDAPFKDNSKIHFLAKGLREIGIRLFEKYKEIVP